MGSDVRSELAGLGAEAHVAAIEGEVGIVEGKGDGLGLPGLELDALEGFELANGAGNAAYQVLEVELYDFYSGHFALVGHIDCDGDALVAVDAAAVDGRFAEVELGIAEAKAERKERIVAFVQVLTGVLVVGVYGAPRILSVVEDGNLAD